MPRYWQAFSYLAFATLSFAASSVRACCSHDELLRTFCHLISFSSTSVYCPLIWLPPTPHFAFLAPLPDCATPPFAHLSLSLCQPLAPLPSANVSFVSPLVHAPPPLRAFPKSILRLSTVFLSPPLPLPPPLPPRLLWPCTTAPLATTSWESPGTTPAGSKQWALQYWSLVPWYRTRAQHKKTERQR